MFVIYHSCCTSTQIKNKRCLKDYFEIETGNRITIFFIENFPDDLWAKKLIKILGRKIR